MSSSPSTDCQSLIEASTLTLYKNNVFRITGLPVDATSKDISKQVQKLQMLAEMGGNSAANRPAFSLAGTSTQEEIRAALSRMKEPENRLVDEFFWYWPEHFGNSKEDPAIQSMLRGDSEGAINLWKQREKEGSATAVHNLAIMYHMHAVDWTNFQLADRADLENANDIKSYWRKSFERWEKVVEPGPIWDTVKDRVIDIDDEALTTGFVRRLRIKLPQALDRVNAEAALAFGEKGEMEWAENHVNFMRETNQGQDDVEQTAALVLAPTRRRVQQHLANSLEQGRKSPERCPELASQVMDRCCPLMGIYDLFHGPEAHQRGELFDEVAETVNLLLVLNQKATGDNHTFVALLKRALEFATATLIREKITENISIGEGNLGFDATKELRGKLDLILASKKETKSKLSQIKSKIISELPTLAMELGAESSAYNDFQDSVALAIRSLAVDLHNDHTDFLGAKDALELALRLAFAPEAKKLIKTDLSLMQEKSGTAPCFFCGVQPGSAKNAIEVPLYRIEGLITNGVRYQTQSLKVARCQSCKTSQSKHWGIMWWGAAVGFFVGMLFIPFSAAVGLALAALAGGGWISMLILKNDSDGRLGCFGIGGTLLLAGYCFSIWEEPVGRNIFLNMAGGAFVGCFLTFWGAKKYLYKQTPEALAQNSSKVIKLLAENWKIGLKP